MIGQKPLKLNVGDKVHYKSKSMIHPEATYEGIVTAEYKHFYEVLGAPIKSTMYENNVSIYGDPIPYKFCINKYLDVDLERVQVVKEVVEKIA